MAFVQNTTPTCIKQPQNGKFQLVNGSGTTAQTVYTAGGNGSKVTALVFSSTDTAAHDVQISITNGGTAYLLGTISVTIGAGNTSTVPSVNALANVQLPGLPLDSDGNPYILLISGDTLQITAVVAVTTAKFVTAIATVGDF
jgi:hypothetical protein